MFRRERPQKGRFRQFTQVGAELIGRDDPASDAETICLADDICRANGVADVRIEINSLGDGACRPAFRDALAAYGHERENELCEDCRARAGRNPMRLLDCKQPGCRELMVSAPAMEDFLCSDCRSHHDAVLALLAEAGVETAPNPAMVRGLDYYCRTAFELVSSRLGAQDAIGGGGRYDGLVEALGGPDVGGVGFAFGLERMLMAAETGAGVEAPRFFVAPVGEAAAAACLRLARRLRSAGHKTETGSPLRRLKAQMKSADRRGARFVVIVGTDELAAGRATVRDMEAKSDHPLCVGLSEDAETVVAAVSALSGDGNES
jgi:histidyl-tRNA synthetase